MIELLLKDYFIIITAFHICSKYTNRLMSKFYKYTSFLFLLAPILVSYYLNIYTTIPRMTITLILYFLIFTLITHLPISISFTVSILSYLISYCLFAIIGAIISPFFIILTNHKAINMISMLTILIGIVTYIISIMLFKIKRIQKGLNIISHKKFLNIGIIIASIILLEITIVQTINITTEEDFFFSIIIFLLILAFLYWFQYQTKFYYLRKLRALELESYRQEIAEKDALIQKLQENNDALARIIHRDNKLIPAMDAAVRSYLETLANEAANSDKSANTELADLTVLRARGTELSHQLFQMTQERKGILTAYENKRYELPQTGYAAIDAVLSYMNDRAAELHITFTVKLRPDFLTAINQVITEQDVTHLLSDLIENAMIATKDSQKRSILVQLCTLKDSPAIEISDSGMPFEPSVFQDFGMRKHSTHLDAGGSGIGLMDIWEIKKKYAASLHIFEYAPDDGLYTKKLSLIFDSKKHYLIRSYRAQEIVMIQARSDMFVLPPE